jgi:polysaccharide chain length determinant protein (PEP-CTERM system associated)
MDEFRNLFRRYGLGVWRKRWFTIAVSWMVCVGGWVFVSAIPNQYEASARLYVDSDAVLTPLLKGLALDNTPVNQLDVLQRTLLSRPNLEKLISKTDLELTITSPADLEELVKGLGAAIKITPQTRNLFTITYRNNTPKLAYDVVQAILSIFIESKVGTNRTDMENARIFLEQQISSYERQLREAEARRAAFRVKYVDLLPSDSTGVSRLEAARNQMQALEGQLKDLLTKRDIMRREMAATPAQLALDLEPAAASGGTAAARTSSGGPTVSPELAQAEERLATLRLKYTEQYPDVVAARNLVEALKSGAIGTTASAASPARAAAAAPADSQAAMARARSRSMPNPIYEQMRMQLFDQEATIASLERQIADATKERDRLEGIARGVPELQAEYMDLNRDYDVLHKNYSELLSRREAMRLAAAADNDADKVKTQIIDPPQVPQVPVAPRRVLLLSAVLVAGFGIGIGMAVLLQQFDHSFHSIEDLREVGLPVVGGISMLGISVPMRKRLFALATFAAAVLLLCVVYGGLLYRQFYTPGLA